jgi:hypothetical protein
MKPLAARVREELIARQRLDRVLPCLLEEVPGESARIVTLRRLLALCGLRPSERALTEALTRLFRTYAREAWVSADRRAVILPGVGFRENGTARARNAIKDEWLSQVEPDHQIPAWHRTGANYARVSKHRFAVHLPDDWSSDKVDPAGNPRRAPSRDATLAQRVLIVAADREAAGHYNTNMEEYVWRKCDWSQFPEAHRQVMELEVIEGLPPLAIAARTGRSVDYVDNILQRHRVLAGCRPRSKQP